MDLLIHPLQLLVYLPFETIFSELSLGPSPL